MTGLMAFSEPCQAAASHLQKISAPVLSPEPREAVSPETGGGLLGLVAVAKRVAPRGSALTRVRGVALHCLSQRGSCLAISARPEKLNSSLRSRAHGLKLLGPVCLQ